MIEVIGIVEYRQGCLDLYKMWETMGSILKGGLNDR